MGEKLDSKIFWKLNEYFNIVQATLLILDIDPSECEEYIEDWDPQNQPTGYSAVKNALITAIERQEIYADIVYKKTPLNPNYSVETNNLVDELNIFLTKVSEQSILKFLNGKPIKSQFFSNDPNGANQFDESGEFYSPKLAAANEAWKAVTTEKHRLNRCTPKQALEKWLEENASRYGLLNSDGSFNKNGIEEVAKIANWKTKGGAPQLTAIYEEPEKESSKANSQQTLNPFDDLDSEFPF